jgi:urea carboxylase
LAVLERLEVAAAEHALATSVIEIPVYYDDPSTRETLMRVRERHQQPYWRDLGHTARVNCYVGVRRFRQS